MKKITLSILFAVFACAAVLNAQASLSFQGVIKNSDGSAVDNGTYSIAFKLYNTDNGGAPVWQETQEQVQVTGGIYGTLLGSVEPLDAPFDETYYLGVAVDGGAELVPRIRLTSSPYALALIGNTNVFASDGNVGVGTTTPEEKLHVIGNVKIEGALTATGGLGFDLSNLTEDIITTENISGNELTIKTITNDGDDITMNAPLRISGTFATFSQCTGCNYFGSTGPFQQQTSSGGITASVAIDAGTGWITSGLFLTNSDSRIKTTLVSSDNTKDLDLLKQLNVTDYRLIENTNKSVKGFIAQEVKEVLPEAVSLTKSFIPSIMSQPHVIKVVGEHLYVELNKPHGLKEADRVRIYDAEGKEGNVLVTEVISEKAFRVENWTKAAEALFVYGKEVNDFHNVDFNQLTALNISSTQELAHKVEQLEQENTKLYQKIERYEEMYRNISSLNKRLSSLETLNAGTTPTTGTSKK